MKKKVAVGIFLLDISSLDPDPKSLTGALRELPSSTARRRIEKVTLIFLSWRSLHLWTGHVFTIPKRSRKNCQVINLYQFIQPSQKDHQQNDLDVDVSKCSYGFDVLVWHCLVNQGEDFAQQVSFTNLRSLTFTDGFDKSLEAILPRKLEKLIIGNDFNQSLDQTELPNNLESLSLGDEFNQRLDAVNLPGTLEELSFGRRFDQSLVDVRLPENLKSLTFGSYYNQSLENVHLPLSLEHLTFGDRFNQSLDYVSLPSNLQSLHFGMHFSRNLEGITWPSNLRSFSCGRQYKESLPLGFVEFIAAWKTKLKLFVCSPGKETHLHN